MKRLFQFTWIGAKLYLREFYSPFFSLVFPIMMLLLFGTIWGNVPDQFFGGLGAVDVSVANFTGISLSVNGILSFPITLAEYRDRKVLKRLQATPASPFLLLASQLIVNVIMTFIGILALVVVGRVVYGATIPGRFLPIVLALVMTLFAMFGIGMLIASAIKSSKAANIVANLIYFPMIFLSGTSLPIQMFPDSLRTVANLLPLTHGVKLISTVWHGGSLLDGGPQMIILGGIAVVFAGLSALLFRWS